MAVRRGRSGNSGRLDGGPHAVPGSEVRSAMRVPPQRLHDPVVGAAVLEATAMPSHA